MTVTYTKSEALLIKYFRDLLQDLWDEGMNTKKDPEDRLAALVIKINGALTLANVMADETEFGKFITYLKETHNDNDQRRKPTGTD
jgi:hypothetical protein